MRFMMNIRVDFPGTFTPEQRAEERKKETMHALEHMHNGIHALKERAERRGKTRLA